MLREWGGYGAIAWTEIDAWARLMRIQPKPWEINAILRLDQLWLNVMSQRAHTFEDDDGESPEQQTRTKLLSRRLRQP